MVGQRARWTALLPFTLNTEQLKPWHTLTGRQHLFVDHDWMHELGEAMPVYRPPLDMHRLFGEPRLTSTGELGLTVRYLTPHSKWSIHSEYQDNLLMLTLSRGGPTVWISEPDAARIGVRDNDWIEAVNRNGVVVARAVVTHKMPEGSVYMYHAQERVVDVPLAETSGRRGGIHNSLTRLLIKPTHLIGGYAQLSFAFNYLGPTGNQRDEVTMIRRRARTWSTDMRVMAQMAMVMNLDKCIGCHTCSVTWTNRSGVGLLGDVRRAAALHRPDALRRRPGVGGGRDRVRSGPLRGPALGVPGSARSGGRGGGAAVRHPRRLDRRRPPLPIWDLIMRYEVALPLHPEYRTMPMVWYIPPLSPVVDALSGTGHDGEDVGNLFGAVDALRIPVEYLAELFTAGDAAPVTAWPAASRSAPPRDQHRHGPRPGPASGART